MKKILTLGLLCFSLCIYGQTTNDNINKLLTLKYAGTYINNDTVGTVGSISVYPETDSTILFYINLMLMRNYNSGSLYGRIKIKNDKGIFYRKYEGYDYGCKWTFKFSENNLNIKTIDGCSECGFGQNVYAYGDFRKNTNKIPDYFLDMTGEKKTFFKDKKPEDFYSIMPYTENIPSGISLKDYFIPSGHNNLAIFNWGGSNIFQTKIWYVKISDSVYKTVEAFLYSGDIKNTDTRTIIISKSDVKVSYVKYLNILTFEETVKDIEPPTTWIKMPLEGQITRWTFKPINVTSKCKAEWTTVKINGKVYKAIKVTNQPFENGKLLTTGITYDYYVEGFGLWKRKLQDGSDSIILKSLEYDSKAN